MEMNKLPISAVICTLNSEKSIRECLVALSACDLEQIIVVDGGSIDETLSIVNQFECLILRDTGQGLGAARNMGISVATQPFLLNCGSDNVMHKKLLVEMLSKLTESDEILGVSCRTKVQGDGYIARMLNLQWQGRIIAGKENILGTPNLFRTELILEFCYSTARAFSDDEDLCTRIRKRHLGNFIVIPDHCFEIGQAKIETLRHRFDYYGKSDFEIYSAYSSKWSVARKFKSYLHPLKSEFLDIGRNLSPYEFFSVAPFLIWATILRYRGWIKAELKNRVNRTMTTEIRP